MRNLAVIETNNRRRVLIEEPEINTYEIRMAVDGAELTSPVYVTLGPESSEVLETALRVARQKILKSHKRGLLR